MIIFVEQCSGSLHFSIADLSASLSIRFAQQSMSLKKVYLSPTVTPLSSVRQCSQHPSYWHTLGPRKSLSKALKNPYNINLGPTGLTQIGSYKFTLRRSSLRRQRFRLLFSFFERCISMATSSFIKTNCQPLRILSAQCPLVCFCFQAPVFFQFLTYNRKPISLFYNSVKHE